MDMACLCVDLPGDSMLLCTSLLIARLSELLWGRIPLPIIMCFRLWSSPQQDAPVAPAILPCYFQAGYLCWLLFPPMLGGVSLVFLCRDSTPSAAAQPAAAAEALCLPGPVVASGGKNQSPGFIFSTWHASISRPTTSALSVRYCLASPAPLLAECASPLQHRHTTARKNMFTPLTHVHGEYELKAV